jgi:hypothetical protein
MVGMHRDKVFIFCKEKDRIFVKRPDSETFGLTFDAILDVCFDVRPPFSEEPRKKIDGRRANRMFFGYPIAATAQNWLHECLVEMVTAIHVRIDAGQAPISWPNVIPAAHRTRIRSKYGLRDRLNAYVAAVQGLNPVQRAKVLTCLNQQNAIADLVSCASDCECLTDLPEAIRDPAKACLSSHSTC